MSKIEKPAVYVIDDDVTVCESIRWLLESVDLQVETFLSGCDFLKSYDHNKRGCVVTDIRMPQMSGLELQQQLILRKSHMPIIMITGHGDIPMAVRAMKAGAYDFIIKPFNEQQLLEQIQKALTLSMSSSYEVDSADIYIERFEQLTPREREVMKLMMEGKLNKQIAYELNIAISTVELHRSHVMQKMQVKSIAVLAQVYPHIKVVSEKL